MSKKAEQGTLESAGKRVDENVKEEKNSARDLAIKKSMFEAAQDKHLKNVVKTSESKEALRQLMRA